MGSWLLEKWIHHVFRRVFVIFFVYFKVKINKRYIRLDTNVFIDLILATQKATCQFTDTLGGTVDPHHWRLIVTYIVKATPITTDTIIIWKIKWHQKLICVCLKCLMLRFIYGVTWDEQSPPDINYDIRMRLFISWDSYSYVPCCEMELQWSHRSPLILRKYTMATYDYQ